MREAEVYRRTTETEVQVKINLDGNGKVDVDTGIEFFNHLITSFSTHSLIDLEVKIKSDLKHHAIEDLAICLGEALSKALENRKGIKRFGYAATPMDDSLVFVAIDLVKRAYAVINLKLKSKKIEDMATEDIIHFFETLAASLNSNIHIWTEYGSNDHHKAEAAIKGLALSIRHAIEIDEKRKGVPSSKGVIG